MKIEVVWQLRRAGAELEANFTMGVSLSAFGTRAANGKRYSPRLLGEKIKNRVSR